MPSYLRFVLACVVLTGCKEDAKSSETKPDEKPSPAAQDASDKAPGKAGSEKPAAKPAPTKVAEATKSTAITACPKALSGTQSVDRTIGKACGVVQVTGRYRVDGATLTLEAGAQLAFADGAELSIGYLKAAKLVVNGTAEAPVVLTSAGDKVAGTWKGVRLYKNANRSSIKGLVVEYAGGKDGSVVIHSEQTTFTDSTIRHGKGPGLLANKTATLAAFESNTFEDVGKVAIRLPANVVGGLGNNNTYPEQSRIHVMAATIDTEARWTAQPRPYFLVGTIRVQGRDGEQAVLTIDPGTTLQFDGDAQLDMGYLAEGSLIAKGTKAKPIIFEGNRKQEPGAWRGLRVYAKGEVELEHSQFRHGGSRAAEGVLFLTGGARASVEQVIFDSNAVGMVAKSAKTKLKNFDNNGFVSTPEGLELHPNLLGSLGATNIYSDGTKITVLAGTVDADATWRVQPGATTELSGNIRIDNATVEVEAGYTALIGESVGLQVGYLKKGTLHLKGTVEQPITFSGERDAPGSWKSLIFYGKARNNRVEHVVLKNAGGDAGVEFKGKSSGSVDTLTCESCSAEVLKSSKDAQVDVKNVG